MSDQPAHRTGRTAHTPGPWFYRTGGDGFIVRSKTAQGPVAGVNGSRPLDEAEANIRLIAAAPELLEAVEDCQKFLRDLTDPDKAASGPNIIASFGSAIALGSKVAAALNQA